ncbi:MAG: enoyl-CoA hydratase/isomerase family protein, partial [Chloroflexota bacterium]
DNGVRVLTFNRPDVLNALNMDTMTAFLRAITALEQDTDMRVLVLTGAGDRAFSSGGDLSELRNHLSEADGAYFTRIVTNTLQRMAELPVPVIAAINGYALGGGSEIALACDMRIVDEKVKMGMVQISMALTPGWGAGQRLLQLVGYPKAMELLLTGEILRADTLKSLGLANKVVPTGLARTHALTFANQIAERPPKVVASIKRLLRAGLTQSKEDVAQLEYDLFAPLWADQPHIDAVEAFFARQAAKKQDTSDA